MVDNITNLLPIPLLEDMKTHLRSVQEAEELKHAQNKELELIRAKTEAVRTAQAALVENRRTYLTMKEVLQLKKLLHMQILC
jgi:hypothetical protein